MINNEKAVLQLMGLCAKAGKMGSGEFQVEDACMRHTAKVVFVSGDASDNTYKKFNNKCSFYKIPFFQLSIDKNQMGRCIGKMARSCAVVLDEGLANAILNKINNDGKVETNQ